MPAKMSSSDASRHETEVKVPCCDLDTVRETLKLHGARKIADGLERNIVFDTPSGKLAESDCLLRLRSYNGGVLTYKGPRQDQSGEIKTRSEIEVGVADFDAACELFLALGFKRTWAYEKFREIWSLGSAEVMLDTLPLLGGFVEVEAQGPDEVASAMAVIGLADHRCDTRTYAEIFRDFTRDDYSQFRDLVFEENLHDE